MLERISLLNYRSYKKLNLSFFKGNHIFVGQNGSGKTNLLESIYFLYQLKSFRTNSMEDLMGQFGQNFHVKGKIINNSDHLISVSYSLTDSKKKLLIDNEISSIKDYTEKNICFFLNNEDILFATQSMGYRRDIMDQLISMINKEYKVSLNEYNKFLKIRRNLLKSNKFSDNIDESISLLGIKIMRARKNIINILMNDFNDIYGKLLQNNMEVRIELKNELSTLDLENYKKQMFDSRSLDLLTKKTNFGIHKEKIYFLLNGKELKKIGSQAQIKLFVYAFKLSIFRYCQKNFKIEPILLLDDIFADLDSFRIQNLFDYLVDFDQIFLTCANLNLISPYVKDIHLYEINHGKISYNDQ